MRQESIVDDFLKYLREWIIDCNRPIVFWIVSVVSFMYEDEMIFKNIGGSFRSLIQ